MGAGHMDNRCVKANQFGTHCAATSDCHQCCSTFHCQRSWIQAECPDIPMSQWVSATVSVWTSPAGHQTWIKAKTEIFINLTTGRAMHMPLYHWWRCIHCRCTTCMEQFTWKFTYTNCRLLLRNIWNSTCSVTWHLMWSALEAACVAYSAINCLL